MRSCNVRSGQDMSGHVRSSEVRSIEVRSSEVRLGWVRTTRHYYMKTVRHYIRDPVCLTVTFLARQSTSQSIIITYSQSAHVTDKQSATLSDLHPVSEPVSQPYQYTVQSE